jgi:hypothetical protein
MSSLLSSLFDLRPRLLRQQSPLAVARMVSRARSEVIRGFCVFIEWCDKWSRFLGV